MRIVGGVFKGRRLESPRSGLVRPTSDRVREAIFSTVGSLRPLEGAAVLDLYAGSGALGLEALSRGAHAAVFVEQDRKVAAQLQRTIATLGVEGSAHVLVADVSRELRAPKLLANLRPSEGWQLVFADPPYEVFDSTLLLEGLVGEGLVERGGLIVLEHEKGRPVQQIPQNVELLKERIYGGTAVSYLAVC